MASVNLILANHNHQPVGNFDHVFEFNYQRSYKPFLEVLKEHPNIKYTLHYTGCLLDWIKEHHPEHLKNIADLVKRGQLEIMSGGYYEPIMPIIPDDHKIEQIKMLTDFVKKNFGYKARGMWLAERVWEPHLPKFINQAGIEYVTLDDSHFRVAGVSGDRVYGYYTTESEGYVINVFPISMSMRYLVPFQPVERVIEFLGSVATEDGTRVVVLADDGEKFGSWPDTYEWVYEKGWLHRFFSALEENSHWIKLRTFSEVIDDPKIFPLGRVYLPDASYEEMMVWALPPDMNLMYHDAKERVKYDEVVKGFLKGGFWRNFLARYPESNNMYSKMLWVFDRLKKSKISGKDKKEANRLIMEGECNCPYWHGEFGGNYLPHLRNAIYDRFIRAENIIDSKADSDPISIDIVDFDHDGIDEVLITGKSLNAYFHRFGGQMFELDVRDVNFNLLNTFTRKFEAYHKKLWDEKDMYQHLLHQQASGEGVQTIHGRIKYRDPDIYDYLKYDWYKKWSFVDHFFGENVWLDSFMKAEYVELGDFVNQPFEVKVKRKKDKKVVEFRRNGAVWIFGDKLDLQLVKVFEVSRNRITADYTITNKAYKGLDYWFAVEFNFALTGDASVSRVFTEKQWNEDIHTPWGAGGGVKMVGFEDRFRGVRGIVKFNKEGDVWKNPLYTVSQDVDKYEKLFQGETITPNWRFHLEPNKSWKLRITLELEKI